MFVKGGQISETGAKFWGGQISCDTGTFVSARDKISGYFFQLWALAISNIFRILRKATVDSTVDSPGFHDMHCKMAKKLLIDAQRDDTNFAGGQNFTRITAGHTHYITGHFL